MKPANGGGQEKIMILLGATVEIETLAWINGMKENYLIGYGLVAGLKGTGDSSRASQTIEAISTMLKKMGFSTPADSKIPTKNIASVLLTARLPAQARKGGYVSVDVISIGDAKSLSGGYLLPSPLKSPSGKIYGVAQGPVITGSVETKGTVPMGMMIEKDIEPDPISDKFTLVLEQPSLTLANSIAQKINESYPDSAKLAGPATVEVKVPIGKKPAEFAAEILKMKVKVPPSNVVVLDSSRGVIVVGGNVVIGEAAVVVGSTSITIGRNKGKSGIYLSDGTKASDLVDMFNRLGFSASQIVAIFQALYEAGAIKGRLVVK